MNLFASIPLLFVLLVLLLGLSAFFSGSETALMAISRLRLKHLAESNPRQTRLVEKILKEPEKLIGTILLGNNLVNVAMSSLATVFAISVWGEKGIVYVTGILTLVILIFAEITPKVYAKYFNEKISILTAPILNILILTLKPIVWAVTFVSNTILLIMGINVKTMKRPLMTEEEIHTCINIGWDDGALSDHEKKLLSRVFTLNDKTVGDIMVPKAQMTTLSNGMSPDHIAGIIIKSGYSRFPVKKVGQEDFIGFIHVKDFFEAKHKAKAESIKRIIRPINFVSSHTKIDDQLRSFKATKIHQSLVLDDTGKIVGLVTLEDILEELVGSIQDEHDRE